METIFASGLTRGLKPAIDLAERVQTPGIRRDGNVWYFDPQPRSLSELRELHAKTWCVVVTAQRLMAFLGQQPGLNVVLMGGLACASMVSDEGLVYRDNRDVDIAVPDEHVDQVAMALSEFKVQRKQVRIYPTWSENIYSGALPVGLGMVDKRLVPNPNQIPSVTLDIFAYDKLDGEVTFKNGAYPEINTGLRFIRPEPRNLMGAAVNSIPREVLLRMKASDSISRRQKGSVDYARLTESV